MAACARASSRGCSVARHDAAGRARSGGELRATPVSAGVDFKPLRVESAAARHRGKLVWVIGLTGTYLVAEVIGAFVTGSLALLADAGFMFTDLVAVSLALAAIHIGARPATPRQTFGYYRAEVLAALANAALMLLICAYILFEAYQRLRHPRAVMGDGMMAVAVIGLIVNLVGAWLLREASRESLNLRGAYLEVLGDTLGSLAVIAGGLVIWRTGWRLVDPILSVGIGLFILPRAWSLLKESLEILMEGTPRELDLERLRRALASIDGVVGVHDLHAWTITSGMTALAGHLVVADMGRSLAVLTEARRRSRAEFGLEHVTLQVEPPDFPEAAGAVHA